jgi:hypothetical protein
MTSERVLSGLAAVGLVVAGFVAVFVSGTFYFLLGGADTSEPTQLELLWFLCVLLVPAFVCGCAYWATSRRSPAGYQWLVGLTAVVFGLFLSIPLGVAINLLLPVSI